MATRLPAADRRRDRRSVPSTSGLAVGDLCELSLTGLAAGGEAIGRLGRFVFFVEDGVPGDEVEVEVKTLHKNFGRARISRILQPSPERVLPRCPVFYQCGGCQVQHIDYPAQLRLKTQIVRDAMERVAHLEDVPVRDCVGSDDPWFYRNKVQFVTAARPSRADARPVPYMGLYARQTHTVVAVEVCAIQHPLNNQVLQAATAALQRLPWDIYDERTGRGLLRYVVARVSAEQDAVLVTLVVTHPDVPQVQEFVDLLREAVPQVRGVLLNVNPQPGNVVLSQHYDLLWGEDHVVESIAGLQFRISAGSFFQVNREMTERLYGILGRLLPLQGTETVLDAFCGTGTLSLWLAGRARHVIGVEDVAASIEDARINAALNKIRNAEFRVGTVEDVLPRWTRQDPHLNAIVLDPPRKGCDPAILEAIGRMRIPTVAYVSCNPSTLARDLELASQAGYSVQEIQPIDMFPHTAHVECVARLVRS